MISAARRRPIRNVSEFYGWDGAYQDALLNDTVRPIHVVSYVPGYYDNININAEFNGERVILESCALEVNGPSFIYLNGDTGGNSRYLDLMGVSVGELRESDGNTAAISQVFIRGTTRSNRPSIGTVNLESSIPDSPPAANVLDMRDVDATYVLLNGSQASPGDDGTGGENADGAVGTPGNNEDMYVSPSSGGTGGTGGYGANGSPGNEGYNATGSAGCLILWRCNVNEIRIHPSYGGNGGNGGNGGSANGGQGGPGGDAYTASVAPGSGGNGGTGGNGGEGGPGGNGGNGSTTIAESSSFNFGSIGTLVITAAGGSGGIGGTGGSASGGQGGNGGYNENYYGVGMGYYAPPGNSGSDGTPGSNGLSALSGGNGGVAAYSTDGTTITTII